MKAIIKKLLDDLPGTFLFFCLFICLLVLGSFGAISLLELAQNHRP